MSLLTRGVDPERLEEELTGYQRAVSILLYVALFAHGFGPGGEPPVWWKFKGKCGL